MSDISEWNEKIDTVLFAYRVSKNKSTGYSPYFMMYHRQPRLPIDVEFLPNHSLEDENVEEFLSTVLQIKDEIKDKASANITKAQSQQKEYFDRRHFVEVCCISAMFIVMTSYHFSNSKRELKCFWKTLSNFSGREGNLQKGLKGHTS